MCGERDIDHVMWRCGIVLPCQTETRLTVSTLLTLVWFHNVGLRTEVTAGMRQESLELLIDPSMVMKLVYSVGAEPDH